MMGSSGAQRSAEALARKAEQAAAATALRSLAREITLAEK